MNGPDVIRARSLSGVPHGFLGRRGGVSTGAVAGLNCGFGSGDDRALVSENRRRAVEAVMPGARLVAVHQFHGAVCVEAGEWSDDERPRADALVTDRPGLLLGIVTADCAPVLLADAEAGVVGAVHAGWRGAAAGVTESAIAGMLRLGARIERIAAAVGPCIAQRNYEVDSAFEESMLADDPASERFFAAGPSHKPHFDLEAFVAARLAAAGVARVETLGLDTYADEARFYSYRRATHRGEASYGRQISMIGLSAR